jgi:hypothetical protein
MEVLAYEGTRFRAGPTGDPRPQPGPTTARLLALGLTVGAGGLAAAAIHHRRTYRRPP